MNANNVSNASLFSDLVQQSLLIARQSLDTYFDSPSQIELAFGSNYNQTVASQLFTAFSQGNFSEIPEIKILSDDVLGATNGAYSASKNEIYLNERFLSENVGDAQAIASVIIEEIGHYIDAQINTTDSAGDEGDIFSRLVNGETLGAETLANLKAENDWRLIVLNGEEVAIEQNTWSGDDSNNFRSGGAGNDIFYGRGGNDSLYGNDGNDFLDGGTGDDYLDGGNGNDTLNGGGGNNRLFGFDGNDTLVSYSMSSEIINSPFRIVEEIGNFIFGTNDWLDGGGHNDYLNSGWGDDTLYGGWGDDTLYAEHGNDQLYGGDQNDQLFGGDGDDYLDGGNGDDFLNGGDGNDQLYGRDQNDQLFGGAGDDYLDGGNGNDTLNGGDGNNRLFGFDGNDTLISLGNNDYLDGGGHNDSLNSGWGNDTLLGGWGDDTLYAEHGNDQLYGGNQNDQLFGGDGDDYLDGGNGDDFLNGGNGNDILKGGLGTNYLQGGQGNDIFVVQSGGTQIIQDFERNIDKLDITQSGLQRVVLAPNNGNTKLIDQNGQELATIQGKTLSTQDLILITQSEQQSLFPTLNVSEQNITGLIKAWADQFAQQKGSSINGNIDMSRVKFQVTNINISQPPKIPSRATENSVKWANGGNAGEFSYTDKHEKTLATTITTEKQTSVSQTAGVSTNFQFSVSNTVTASAGVEIGMAKAGVENSSTISASFGVTADYSKTFGQVLTESNSKTESRTQGTEMTHKQQVAPESVFSINTVTYTGTHNAPITMNYSVEGNFRFTLNNGQSYTVPINAILQHYDLKDGTLDTFNPAQTANLLGTDFDGNGTSLFYADQLNFNLTGLVELDATFSQTTTNVIMDVLLNGSILTNDNLKKGLKIETDDLTGQEQVHYTASSGHERLWIIKDSFTTNMSYDIITGFTPKNDKIGIAHSLIDGLEDLNITYSGGNADIKISESLTNELIHLGYFAAHSDAYLAKIKGVDPNSLTSSDFVFSTKETYFDTGSGVNWT